MSAYIDILIDYIGWGFIILSVYYSIRWYKYFIFTYKLVIPSIILGMIFAFANSAANTLLVIDLSLNLKLLMYNCFLVFRNSFFAMVALALLQVKNIPLPIVHWEESAKRIKEIITSKLIALIILQIIYSYILFSIFSVKINVLNGGFPQYLNDLSIGLLSSVVEELLIRVFMISILLYYFGNSNKSWWIAIIITTFYWSLLHYQDNVGWIKIVQIFPLGIILGYYRKAYGYEASLFIHGLYNMLIITIFALM